MYLQRTKETKLLSIESIASFPKSGGRYGFLLLILSTQYLCMAGSWATKMLQPASFGVAKNSPGAIPGVKRGALGSSWNNFIRYLGVLTMKVP